MIQNLEQGGVKINPSEIVVAHQLRDEYFSHNTATDVPDEGADYIHAITTGSLDEEGMATLKPEHLQRLGVFAEFSLVFHQGRFKKHIDSHSAILVAQGRTIEEPDVKAKLEKLESDMDNEMLAIKVAKVVVESLAEVRLDAVESATNQDLVATGIAEITANIRDKSTF